MAFPRIHDPKRSARLQRLARRDERALGKALRSDPLEGAIVEGGPGWRLMQGDSLELLANMPSRTVDLVFADPPYNLSNGGTSCQSGRRVSVNKGDWDKSYGVAEDHAFHTEWLAQVQRVLKPSGTLWVSGTQHVIFSIGFAMQQLGFHLLNTVTWFKPNAPPNLACRYLTHSSELVIWASPRKTKPLLHHFSYKELKEENGGKQMRDLWTFSAPPKSEKTHGKHPTQKPVVLLDRIIRAASVKNALVLDPFNGSGTTGVAALRNGRRYIGLEREREYIELSARRLRDEAPEPKKKGKA